MIGECEGRNICMKEGTVEFQLAFVEQICFLQYNIKKKTSRDGTVSIYRWVLKKHFQVIFMVMHK